VCDGTGSCRGTGGIRGTDGMNEEKFRGMERDEQQETNGFLGD